MTAAGRLEILARVIGHHAVGAAWSMESDEFGTDLGVTGDQAEELLDRYRRM